ncbi:MAG: hypothetical protein LBE49_06440 [Deltaproteobacteria bacterium]|nr:hypothetical protein [Deltaproteobacteria bacterium]
MRKQHNINSEVFEMTCGQRRLAVFERELAMRTFESLEGGSEEDAALKAGLESLETGIGNLKQKNAEARKA